MTGKTQFKGILILLLTAIIWGSSFVAQDLGIDNVQAFTFMGVRTILGSIFLLPIVLVQDFYAKRKMTEQEKADFKINNKKTFFYGIILGIIVCFATNIQQFAFYYSSAGKIAFITASYMFFVPVVGVLFLHKKYPFITWICVLLGFTGLYFLSFKTNSFGSLNKGDVLTFICSLFFCAQILLIEKFSQECDGIKLSCIEFFTSGIITCILMFIFEKPEWTSIKAAGGAILYSGIMSCGIAYTLQIIGQKYCEASIASLIMCMESVFAVLSAAIILHERLTLREGIGCIIMFTAILISQLYDIAKNKKEKKIEQDSTPQA